MRDREGVGGVEFVGVGEARDVTESRGDVTVVIEPGMLMRRVLAFCVCLKLLFTLAIGPGNGVSRPVKNDIEDKGLA